MRGLLKPILCVVTVVACCVSLLDLMTYEAIDTSLYGPANSHFEKQVVKDDELIRDFLIRSALERGNYEDRRSEGQSDQPRQVSDNGGISIR